MSDTIRDKLHRKLDGLPDEPARQLLDYLEFLESKYNRSRRKASPFERLGETIEGTFSAEKLSDAAAKGTADVAEAAGRIMGGLAAAARAAADEFQAAARASRTSPPAGEASKGGAEGQVGEESGPASPS